MLTHTHTHSHVAYKSLMAYQMSQQKSNRHEKNQYDRFQLIMGPPQIYTKIRNVCLTFVGYVRKSVDIWGVKDECNHIFVKTVKSKKIRFNKAYVER